MVAEHAPPPCGEPGPESAERDRGALASAAEEAVAAGDPRKLGDTAAAVRRRGDGIPGEAGATTPAERVSRLQPSRPALEHAPLLLGLDAAGREHPQGGENPDDENLVGRVWGCVCGWRGAVRDVSTRPFHPRVGDGGGLRRQRLARSDRDTRAELEAHLARSTPAPPGPPATVSPAPAPSVAANSDETEAPQQPGNGRPRGRRRRLTVPRDIPLAVPPVTALPTVREQFDGYEHDAPSEDRATTGSPVGSRGPTDSEAARGSPQASAIHEPLALLEPAAADYEAGLGERSFADQLESAVVRAGDAQAELAAAERALDAAVAAAREDGLSWRTIGRATGLGHREAVARWGPPGRGPSL